MVVGQAGFERRRREIGGDAVQLFLRQLQACRAALISSNSRSTWRRISSMPSALIRILMRAL